jgi:hypothetical protein
MISGVSWKYRFPSANASQTGRWSSPTLSLADLYAARK